MTAEENTKHVVDLSLVPVGSIIETADTGHRRCLIGVCLHTDTGVVSDTQHVVDNLESLVAGREVDSGNIGDLCELASGVVPGPVRTVPLFHKQ